MSEQHQGAMTPDDRRPDDLGGQAPQFQPEPKHDSAYQPEPQGDAPQFQPHTPHDHGEDLEEDDR